MSNSELLDVYLEKESNAVQEKRLFICSLCPYRTDRRNNLKRHTSTMHEQSSAVLECCGTRFANKAALRHHTTAYHRNGYICTICGRVFCRRALLRRHHAVHSGFKEFACNLCDYATSHKSNLERHMKIHEGGEKQYASLMKQASMQNKAIKDNVSTDTYSEEDEDDDTVRLSLSALSSPIVRDHNPILASLLSQPTSHSDHILQWSYRTAPYDYSMPTMLNNNGIDPSSPSVASGSTPSPPSMVRLDLSNHRWTFDAIQRRDPSLTVIKDNNALPLRHAIDVILGVQKEQDRAGSTTPDNSIRSMTTSSQNHWAISHVTSAVCNDQLAVDLRLMYSRSTRPDLNMDSGIDIDSDRSSVGSKRRWTDGSSVLEEPSAQSPSAPNCSPSSDPRRCSSPEGEDGNQETVYIPKKLRMSKRYQ